MGTSKQLYKWAYVGDLMVSVVGGSISGEDWTRFMTDLRTKPINKYLSYVLRGEVSSLQRKQASELMSSRNLRVAIVTNERLIRGAVTAASWLGVDVKAFDWTDLSMALTHLGVAGHEIGRITQMISDMKNELS